MNTMSDMALIQPLQNGLLKRIEQEMLQDHRQLYNSRCYALLAWQKMISRHAEKHKGNSHPDILGTFQKAIELDSLNVNAYILMGTYCCICGDTLRARDIWNRLKILSR